MKLKDLLRNGYFILSSGNWWVLVCWPTVSISNLDWKLIETLTLHHHHTNHSIFCTFRVPNNLKKLIFKTKAIYFGDIRNFKPTTACEWNVRWTMYTHFRNDCSRYSVVYNFSLDYVCFCDMKLYSCYGNVWSEIRFTRNIPKFILRTL